MTSIFYVWPFVKQGILLPYFPGGEECPGYMFRNVFCHQSGLGMIEDESCSEEVSGKKPPVAKACDQDESKDEETAGPQVCILCLGL